MDNDTTTTTPEARSDTARLADAAERIASALEGLSAKPKTDPMAVDSEQTHQLVTEYKDRTGIKDV